MPTVCRKWPGLVESSGLWLVLTLLVSSLGCSRGASDTHRSANRLSAGSQRARQYRDYGKFDLALAAYDSALQDNPRDEAAQLDPVLMLIHLNRLPEAAARAKAQLEKTPTSPSARLAAAEVVFQRGDLQGSRKLLDSAVAPPDAPDEVCIEGARLYRALGRTGRGVELLERVRARNGAGPEVLGLIGDYYSRMTNPQKAAEAYAAALKGDPGSEALHRNLGRALLMLRQPGEASQHFQEALRLKPEEPYSLYYLGVVRLEEGQSREAADLLTRSLSKDDMNPKAHYALARALLALGDHNAAQGEFERHADIMKRIYHAPAAAASSAPVGWDLEEGTEESKSPSGAAVLKRGAASADRFDFVDIAPAAGISQRNVSGGPRKEYIIESIGSGACWLDYDGDSWMDLFLPNGLPMRPESGPEAHDALYRNLGNGRFEETTHQAGIIDSGWGHGCAVGDYDNDSDADLYVTNRGRNALYRNEGNGTFREVGHATRTDDPGWSTSAAFADYDRDGWLDLVVANYVEFDLNLTPAPGSNDFCRILSMPTFCGPRGLPMAKNRLYHNRGDGTFEDVTERAGFRLDRGFYSLGLVWGDVDDDGDPDLYVATDSTPNLLYRNNGDGTFTEVGTETGVAYNEEGREQAGMGTDMADYDNDGDVDIVVTNFAQDSNTLYRQDRPGSFSDVSFPSGIGEPSLPYLGWGVGLVDLDHDGWKDLFVVNGHTQPQVDQYPQGTTYRQRRLLFANRGDGTFEEVGLSSGPGMQPAAPGRAAAFADFDNDGDLDILVTNIDEAPSLLENRSAVRSHWIGFKLVGTNSNRDALGSRLTLKTDRGEQVAEVRAGYSYLASNDPRVVFGLGPDPPAQAYEVRVRWPRGSQQVLRGFSADRYHRLVEPDDRTAKSHLRDPRSH